MSQDHETESSPPERDADIETLRARIELYETELERLRNEYARSKQTEYRRTAGALAVLGVLAFAGGVVFPSIRTTLVIIGSIGVFGSVLTYYLTPETFVAATVGERQYNATATNYDAIIATLGLSETCLYVPDATDTVRLFVPEFEAYEIPEVDDLDTPFVVSDNKYERGLVLRPVGMELFGEFERTLTGSLGTNLHQVGTQLMDALIEQFELVERADIDASTDQLTVSLDTTVYGDLTRFDHPVVSFLAVGVVRSQSVPVTTTIADGDDRFEWIVTIQLEA